MNIDELIDKALQYILGMWRFRWLALIIAWTIAVLGWVHVERLQDKYKASARIQVDSNRILEPLLRGIAIQPDVSERVRLMSKSVLARPNLRRLVEMTSLGDNIYSDTDMERKLDGLQANLELSGQRRNSSLYTVTYTNSNPVVAKEVVESAIKLFVETNIVEGREDSTHAQAFLDKQIAEYDRRLKEAEHRLSDFRRRNAGKMPGEAGSYYQRFDTALEKLRVAELELRKATNRRTELKRQIDGESPSNRQFDSLWQDPINTQISAYQDELNTLLVRYTERHPRVAQLREAIDQLEVQKEQYSGQAQQESRENVQLNPIYQEMRSLLSSTEADIAELQVEVNENKQQVETLRGTIDSIPEIEAELQQLDRDYETLTEQHSTLLARRESALMSERVEENVDDIKFSIVDPPFVPSSPQEPNKLVLNTLVLMLSVGAGLGLSFLLSLLRPVYVSQRHMREATGFPVLGSVTMITTTAARARMWVGRVVFASLTTILLVTFVTLSYLRVSGQHTEVYKRLGNVEIVKNMKGFGLQNKGIKSNFIDQNSDTSKAEKL